MATEFWSPNVSERGIVSQVWGVVTEALGVRCGQEIYVPYRVSARNKPHVKRVVVKSVQITLVEGKGDVSLLCTDPNGLDYVYRYDQVVLDINAAMRYITIQSLREDLGLDEFCHMVDPRFKYKAKKDGEEAQNSVNFDPTRQVDEEARAELLERISNRVLSPAYWRSGYHK